MSNKSKKTPGKGQKAEVEAKGETPERSTAISVIGAQPQPQLPIKTYNEIARAMGVWPEVAGIAQHKRVQRLTDLGAPEHFQLHQQLQERGLPTSKGSIADWEALLETADDVEAGAVDESKSHHAAKPVAAEPKAIPDVMPEWLKVFSERLSAVELQISHKTPQAVPQPEAKAHDLLNEIPVFDESSASAPAPAKQSYLSSIAAAASGEKKAKAKVETKPKSKISKDKPASAAASEEDSESSASSEEDSDDEPPAGPTLIGNQLVDATYTRKTVVKGFGSFRNYLATNSCKRADDPNGEIWFLARVLDRCEKDKSGSLIDKNGPIYEYLIKRFVSLTFEGDAVMRVLAPGVVSLLPAASVERIGKAVTTHQNLEKLNSSKPVLSLPTTVTITSSEAGAAAAVTVDEGNSLAFSGGGAGRADHQARSKTRSARQKEKKKLKKEAETVAKQKHKPAGGAVSK